MKCKVCRTPLESGEGESYVGWGTLCSDCNSRAQITRNHLGIVIRVSVAPKEGVAWA